jgi:hypothetical protein
MPLAMAGLSLTLAITLIVWKFKWLRHDLEAGRLKRDDQCVFTDAERKPFEVRIKSRAL